MADDIKTKLLAAAERGKLSWETLAREAVERLQDREVEYLSEMLEEYGVFD